MYRLVRNFSVASALAILVVSSLIFVFVESLMRDEMFNDAERRNISLAKLISNTMMRGRLGDYLFLEQQPDDQSLPDTFNYRRLDRELRGAITDLGVLKLKLYSTGGRVIYSTDPSQLGKDKSSDPGFRGARAGGTESALVARDSINSFEGLVEDVDLVTTYTPLVVGDHIVGVFEVYRDVTPALARVNAKSIRIAVVVGGMFLALFGVLLVFVKRADGIIRQQYSKTQREIAVRLQAEAALRKSESRLQDFLAAASEWLWETNANHRYTVVSQRVVDAIGVKASDFIGRSSLDLDTAQINESQSDWNAHKTTLEAHQPFRNFVYSLEVDGKEVFIRTNGVPVFNDTGTFIGYRGTGTNVTCEIQAEREMKRSEQKYSLAFRANPAMVVISNLETGIHYEVNDRWCEIMGIPREEAIGKTAHQLHLWKDLAAREAFVSEVRKKRRVSGMEIQLVTKSGEVRDFLADAEVLAFEGDDKFMIVSQDITERKRAVDDLRAAHDDLDRRVRERTRELRDAMESAETASRTKSEFLANMSHELRTPLNAIIGFADIIKHEMFGDAGNKTYVEYATHIKESGEHLLSLINDILDVSAIEAGKLELQEEEFPLSEVIEVSLNLVAERAEAGGLALVNTAAATEDPAHPLVLFADKRRVKQILLNLLSNAIKFTPAGGKVTIQARLLDDGRLSVYVTDTGIGIAKKDIHKALSPFGQVESGLSRLHEGTGLGLNLARNLAELHGGAFRITSKPGLGTRVTIHFPAARVMAAPIPAATGEGNT